MASMVISNGRKRISNGHRGRLDIIADILGASHGGAKKTSLMYHCNLSFRQLEQYLSFMLKNEFLQRSAVADDSNVVGVFEVTDKGKEFIRAYDCLEALMK
jgi:predicted transcriptional regulator